MKKIILILVLFFAFINLWFAEYKLENWSKELVTKYNFSTKNLEKSLSRKEFLETLSKWYPDYKVKKWVKIDFNNFQKIDNNLFFKDVDLNSDFWKKLNYFTEIWVFSKRENFDLNWIISQKDFFTIMKKLWVLDSIQNCKNLKICEKEANEKTIFNKWVYFKYISKILNPELRKYFSEPKDYINAWYKPFLNSNSSFPLQKQTLNWCYAFSVRNTLKYKNNLWINVSAWEKLIWKNPENLWTFETMQKFNKITKVDSKYFYDLDTLINSLQTWEPITVTYNLRYFSAKEKKEKTVSHIVTAYSFDKNGVWVSETVSNSRKNIDWSEIFDKNWKTKINRMFKFYYKQKQDWSEDEKDFEEKNNILIWEY